ncbi:hypothetical protein DFH07DRAFT_960132 [Mycena maculata]|uniref:F-box domain-containing protein n=1 Tax=Mycena maculata TaxID=230809 RepID=A0AAD7NBC1_9AGAR|nr:hypothetical protein DFH07DRAFT_960132 [Mycena maculata]
MSAIALIPNDVLVEIFVACLPQSPGILASHFSQPPFIRPHRSEAPLLLCSISSNWRTLVLAMPRLWRSLDAHTLWSPHLVKLWLERAAHSRALSISLTPTLNPSCMPIHMHLPLLLPVLHRCRNLEVLGWFASRTVQPSLSTSVPLETAAISINLRDTRAAQWFSALFTAAPLLSRLHWVGPVVTAPWSQLTYLSFAPLNPSDFLYILPQLVNLIELHLICCDGAAFDQPGWHSAF